MRFGNSTGNRQPQAGATRHFRSILILRMTWIHAIKSLKYQTVMFRLDALTGISDRYPVLCFVLFKTHEYFALAMGMLYCIRQQINENAPQQVLISINGGLLKRFNVNPYPLCGRQPTNTSHNIQQQLIQMKCRTLQDKTA